MDAAELRAMVQRVAGRALAERGLERAAPSGASRTTPAVQVEWNDSLSTLRPHGVGAHAAGAATAEHDGSDSSGVARYSSALVTADDLRRAAHGGVLRVAAGALVTPAAEEEAFQRGIRIERGGGDARAPTSPRRVAIGCDHGGYPLKPVLLECVRELGWHPIDYGTHSEAACDYPDHAYAVALAVAEGRAELGICIDGAGLGSAITANKVPGVRAAPCPTAELARNAREHNFANVLTLGAKGARAALVSDVVRAFLTTATGAERHARRVAKIDAIEARYSKVRSLR